MWRLPLCLAVVAAFTLPAFGQQEEGLITGTVSTDAGAPIAAAQVTIDNMGLHTVTKDDGSYRLVVPAARATGQTATLSVRLIGFKPKSLAITLKAATQTFDFVLPPQAVVLQQVVVTGEGIITTNEKLGETVNTVTGAQITNSDESNVVNALSGKAPNVQIQSQSGDPGSSTSIQIRGLKSFTGDGQPLFVVDGVPVDNSTNANYGWNGGDVVTPNRIADVNPADIESVTILKGAAASAIYGARASQGVVLITTKSGNPGATRYSVRASYSANDVTRGYPLQQWYGQTSVPSPSCGNCRGSGESWGARLTTVTPVYDHFREMFETGSVWDLTMSLSGGDDRRSFYLSGGYSANQGYVIGPNDYYNRATVTLKGSQIVSDRFRVGAKINYVNGNGSYVQRGDNVDGIMLDALRTPPEFNNFHYLDTVSEVPLHRSYQFPNPNTSSIRLTRYFNNPLFDVYEEPSTSNLSRVIGNIDVNWAIADGVTLQWTPGLDYYTDARFGGYSFTASNWPEGFVFVQDFKNFIVSSVITVVGQHTFNPALSGSWTIGNEINATHFSNVVAVGDDLITAQPLSISNTQIPGASSYEQRIHRQSYFGQITGDLYDQLYLSVALRNDGYSTFSQNWPRAWYPKASLAWTLDRVLALPAHGMLQFARLRAAYGQTGKEPQAYSTLAHFSPTGFGGGLRSDSTTPNAALRPERQSEIEGGVDVGFFDGIATLSASVYSSKATDVIIRLPLSPSSGSNEQISNAATIQNRGTELQLALNSPNTSRSVQWTLGLMWAQNRNTVLALGAGVTEVPVGNADVYTASRVGYPTGSMIGQDFIRCGRGVMLDPLNPLAVSCVGRPTGSLYIGADGLPVFDPTQQVLGSAEPDWAGAVHGTITFLQRWQLSFLVDIRHGSQAYNGTRGALYHYGVHKDTEIRNTMQVFGSPTWHPGPVVGPGAGQAVLIDANWFENAGSPWSENTADFIEGAGFTKLREIAIQYVWDGPWVTSTLGFSSVAFRLAGRNLATWTGYTGIDPESNLEGANIIQGVDWFNNPQSRSFVFSLALNR